MKECTPEQVRQWLAEGLGDGVERLEVDGDGMHFQALIVCAAFAGLPRVRRHRMVYAALQGRMDGDIHALSLRLLAPGEDDGKT